MFVIGGVCHSEIRAAYEAMHAFGREVTTVSAINTVFNQVLDQMQLPADR